MTTFLPQYRLAIYAPRSQDPTETTVLTPIGGAPHSDAFRVATVAASSVVAGASVADNFNALIGTGSNPIPAPWVQESNAIYHYNAGLWPSGSDGVGGLANAHNIARYGSSGLGVDQEAQIVLTSIGAGVPDWAGPMVRCQTGAASGYIFKGGTVSSVISKIVAGVETSLVSGGPAAANGDTLKLRVTGTLLEGLKNGVVVLSVSDATFASGDPGIYCYGIVIGMDDFFAQTVTPATWKPYLHFPDVGRHGIVDVREKTSDTGLMYFELIDPPLDQSDPLARWLPAFLGDLKGQHRSGGLLVRAWESLDNGATWPAFWTGRLRTLEQRNPTRYRLGVRDMGEDLEAFAFVGRPHASVTYAAPAVLLPVASTSIAYGRLLPLIPLKGTIGQHATYPKGRRIILDAASRNRTDNVVTENLMEACPFGETDLFARQTAGAAKPLARVRVKRLDTNAVDYFLAALSFSAPWMRYPVEFSRARVLEIGILENGNTFPPYGTAVEVWIETEGEISAEAPFLISDVHCVTMIKHLVEGKFGFLYTADNILPPGKAIGDVALSMPTDSATFTALEADDRLPTVRFVITAREPRRDMIQRLCQMANLAWFLDGDGVFTLIDLRTPTDVSAVPTITDADLLAAPPAWENDRGKVITRFDATYYLDVAQRAPVDASTFVNSISTPRVGSLVKSFRRTVSNTDVGTGELSDTPLVLDLPGFRYMLDDPDAQDRGAILDRQVIALAYDTARPFATGAPTLKLRCQRGGNGDAAAGSLRKISIRSVPDPATNKLGGTRLVRVLERQPRQAGVDLTVMDMGQPTVAATPVLGVPVVQAGNTTDGVTVNVTLNAAGDPVEIHYAITDTSVGSAPAVGDSLWSIIANGLVRVAGDVSFHGLSAGKRIWVRGRSFPDARTNYKLPSAWVAASSPGRVDLFILSPVESPTGSLQTSRSFRASWFLRANMIKSSEDLRTAGEGNPVTAWTAVNTTLTADAIAAPDGIVSADKVVETAINASHQRQQIVTIVAGNPVVVEGFFHAGQRTQGNLVANNAGDQFAIDFDTAGAGSSATSAVGAAAVISSLLINVGGGWWYVWVSGTVNAGSTAITCTWGLRKAGAASYLGILTEGAYWWGCQAEQAVAAGNYIKTTTGLGTEPYNPRPLEILIATPTGDPRVVVARLPGGSAYYDFPGDTNVVLQPSTTYRVGIRHTDGVNSVSAEVTVDIATTAVDPAIELPHPPRQFF